MRHVRMLGLCLVAALALGAYATSSAMAGPQWVQCKAASELEALGFPFEAKQVKYTDANCTEKQPKEARAYVLLKFKEVENLRLNYLGKETANVPFSGGSVGGGGILSAGVRDCSYNEESHRLTRQKCAEEGGTEYPFVGELPAVECEAENNTGEAEGKNKVANVHVTFTGCLYSGAAPCTSPGAAEGEINTSTLKGKLGWINKSTKEVGVVLEPAAKHGLFASFTCSEVLEFWVGQGNKKEGSGYVQGPLYPEGCEGVCPGATPEEEKHGGYDQIISPITPVNTMTSEFTQVYALAGEAPWGNIPHKLEGKHISALENTSNVLTEPVHLDWIYAGEEITNVNEPEEAGEIKA